jgi:phage tail-like protein
MPAIVAPRIPMDKFQFILEIEGIEHARFQSVSEIGPEVGEVVYREGGGLAPVVKDPGLYNVPDVTLARGSVHTDSDLWDWFESVARYSTDRGDVAPFYRYDIDLILRDRDHTELLRWRLYDTWPKKFVAGDFDGESEEKVIEQVTLSVRGVRRLPII